MNIFAKGLLVLVSSVGLASLAVVPTVSARGVGGSAARATNAADANCFNVNSSGGVVNLCGTTKNITVPLPVDATSSKAATFGGNNLSCRLEAADQLGGSFVSSGSFQGIGNTPGLVGTPAFTMPGAGKLWLNCSVVSAGTLSNVNYTP